ncbi:MAG: D-alanine--D-alanine ligase, partial [Desulfobacteraceae bacterium]|nr:D-alanine--D-alanine ligase [Desulfobacteraceae bacterium]
MKKIKLALLSGGISSEREVSLNSGNEVFKALDKTKYEILRYDPKTDIKNLVNDADKIDVALIILHGPYGEDGTVQGLLDLLNIPYQSAGVLGNAIAMNKLASKRLYSQAEIPTPDYIALLSGKDINLNLIKEKFGFPQNSLVVKPVCAGSSVGMSIVKKEEDLNSAIKLAFEHDNTVLIEAYIKGVELTCGVLGNKEIEALPVIEIVPGEGYEFFNYEAKYVAGATNEICPARIDEETTKEVQRLAKEAHKALFLKGYSRTDLMFSDNGNKKELFVLETNTIPGMTATSLYPQQANVAGYPFPVLLD